MSRPVRAFFVCGLLSLGAGWGVSLGEGIRLAEAEIIKVQWDTRDLSSADLDGDGLLDLAVINNGEARIDFYYQLAEGEKAGASQRRTAVDRWEPVLEDARFDRVKVLTGGMAYDLALGDLNGDGRIDLVYANDRDEIVLHLQGDDGDWAAKKYYEYENLATVTGALWIGDLAGDGKNDLVCLTQNGLMIFPDAALDEKPHRYACVYDGPLGLTVRDLDGDGRLDLVYYYLNQGKKSAMAVRFQNGDGRFVSERFFEYERSSNFPVPVNWSSSGGGVAQSFMAVSAANQTLIELKAAPVEPGGKAESAGFQRMAYAVPRAGGEESHYAVADFNGDQLLDVVASDGAGAQVWFYQQTSDGDLRAPESFPALADINGLAGADTNGDGRAELIMISEKEGALGVARFSQEGRFEYPEIVALEGAPEFMVAADFNGDGRSQIVCSVEGESNRKQALVVASYDSGSASWGTKPLAEEEVGSRLQGLRAVDINQDGLLDVLALSLVQPLEILLQGPDGSFARAKGSVAGLADKVAPSAVTQGDLNGDGKEELLITRETFARSARLGDHGRAQVMDQINAPDAGAELLVSVVADVRGDESPELLLVEGQERKIHVMARDAKNVYRLASSHPGVSEVTDSLVTDADLDGTPDLFLFEESRFWWYRLRPDTFAIEEKMIYETDLKDTVYGQLVAGPLDGDGRDDLVVFDTVKSHVMELLLAGEASGSSPDASLRSTLHFKLFEVDPHFQGQRGSRFQPHASILADLNADGRKDIAVLMHDRLIIYPQQ